MRVSFGWWTLEASIEFDPRWRRVPDVARIAGGRERRVRDGQVQLMLFPVWPAAYRFLEGIVRP